MKASKALLVTAAMTAGLLALAFGLWGHYARLTAEHWQAQLDATPDEGAGSVPEDSLAARWPLPVGPADADAVRHQPATADDVTELGRSLVSLSRLPGGGLPIDSVPQTLEPQDAGPILLGDTRSGHPRRLVTPPGARALSTWQQPERSSGVAQQAGTGPASQAPSNRPPREPNPLRNLSLTAEDHAPLHNPPEQLAEMETVQLMQWLGRPQGPRASAARAELMRRGFTEVHLELARQLFDPDPEVRKRLARLLPAVQSVDAAPWLLWLSRDPDPEVRLAAIGLIATSGDAALWEQIEQAAREDPDPQIQRQAELIAARRNRDQR